jgi:FkbM family methyltransferase
MSVRLRLSKFLKKYPPAFDAARKITRMLGDRPPIHEFLSQFAAAHSKVSFVQIGTNDGISVDPIREFVVANAGWNGVFVEPIPWLCELARQNYSYVKNRNFTFLNAAVSNESGNLEFWKVKEEFLAEFPPFAYQVGSFDKSHVAKHFPHIQNLEEKIESIQVQTITFEEVLSAGKLSQVDLLHLDAEGHEEKILLSIPFERLRPKVIQFEVSHMDEASRGRIFSLLQSHGYLTKPSVDDIIAYLPEAHWNEGHSRG